MGVKTRRAETELKMNQPLSYSVTSATAQSLTSNFTTLFFPCVIWPPFITSSVIMDYQQMAKDSRRNIKNDKILLTQSMECREEKTEFVFLNPTIYRTLQISVNGT